MLRFLPQPSLPAILSLITLAFCGSTASESEIGSRWVLEEDVRIGALDGLSEYTFGSIRGVFPGPDDGMWVLEAQIPELRLYDSSGTFVRRVGRRGEGPGEFTGNVCAYAAADGEIWVEDSRRRWQRFDSTGVLLGSLPVTSNVGCGVRVWTSDGRILVVNSELISGPPSFTFSSNYVEHTFASDGLIPGDTFPVPELADGKRFSYTTANGGNISTFVPFTHRPAFTVGESGSFWIGDQDGRYFIERRSLQGEILATVDRPFSPVAIPDSVREDAIRQYQPEVTGGPAVISLTDLPSTYPPFDRIAEAEDGRLWVWRHGSAGIEIDVLSPLGEYLGRVTTPAYFASVQVNRITADHVYGVFRDELDVQYAIRFRIRPSRI